MPSIYAPPPSATGGVVSGVLSGPSTFAFSNNGSVSVSASNTATVRAPDGIISNDVEVNMEDLESLPFSTPIETLLNLWVARYGNEWVDVKDVLAEEFYGLTYKRLKSMGKLETHYLTNKSRFVCRKPI
jgi:hypothetical protein